MGSTVLVVDDSMLIRKQVGRSLLGAGYNVEEACDGAEALQKIAALPDIGLVICDITMPVVDGLQFLEELRLTPAARLPVVMLTTEGHPDLMIKARELGALAWIIKPFKPDTFLNLARKFLPAPQIA